MSNIKIQDVDQRIQYTATSGQTAFSIPFPFFANSDIVAYSDSTLLVLTTNYTLTGADNPSGGTLTLVVGATTGDIITIYGALPIDRTSIYSATISNLTGSDLNQDFNREVVMMKQIETTQSLLQLQYAPYAEVSQTDTVTTDRWLPILTANQVWAKNGGNTAMVAYNVPSSGSIGPADATYITQTSNSDLTNEQAMGSLSSGLVVNTTTTGVQLTRTLTGTSSQIGIANGNGISGNPTFSLSDNTNLPGTEGCSLPTGTTAQRPGSPREGEFRFNSTLFSPEYWTV